MNIEWSKVKESTEAIKNICVLLFYGVATIFFFFVLWPTVKDWKPKKGSIGGIEWGPEEKEAKITIDAISNKVPKEGRDTAIINSSKLISAAKTLDTTINRGAQNWVYIGQIINGKLTNSHFKINDIPKAGDVITAKDAVYKRKDLPLELSDGSWKLGDIGGVVADNESVKVNVVNRIEDDNYWALVQ